MFEPPKHYRRRATLDATQIRDLLAASLRCATRETGVSYQVSRDRQDPLGVNRTFVRFDIQVGYALSEELRAVWGSEEIERGESVTKVVPKETSLNGPIYAVLKVDVDRIHPLQISSPEDAMAEKLWALFQQLIRSRSQRNDQLDITVNLREHPQLNWAEVAEYLLRKTAA